MKSLQELADRWPQIDALLEEALALPTAQRTRWLASLEGERAALRDTVAQLLAAHDEAEAAAFMDALPALAPSRAGLVQDDPAAGDTIGPYRLLAPLGHGGMGVVWLAERADGQLKRQVALKLPRLAWGRGVAERLARERDILATLEHPHIARLYDAGVDQHGRPYLALELVAGQPIDVYCRERALRVGERLALLLQAAAAVAHAHAHLVVHRDLKPANILVTSDGQVRLLDFGIAKLLEEGEHTRETALTRVSGAALTLDYASPEQIRGESLTTASDVYSLAVVSYELLTGTRPYRLKRGSAAELEEAISVAEPMPASAVASEPALKKVLRGDLDAILNHALKKDPSARYPGVAAFAAEIERFLRHEPVLARPDSRWDRARRLVLRNWLAVGFSFALAMSIVAGAGAAVWQAVRASSESQRALAEVARQQAVRDLYLEATTRLSTLAAAGSTTLSEPHAVSRMLESQLRSMAPRYASRPREWQALLEAVMLQLNYSSDFDRSLVVGQEYMAHLQQHGAAPALVINAHAALGRTLFQLGRLDESEAMRRAGLQWAPDVNDTVTELARLALATDLGNLLQRRGQRAEAQRILQDTEARAARVVPDHQLRYANLVTMAALALNFDDALALRLARQGRAGMVASGTAPGDDHADTLQTLALALQANGLAAEAEVVLREALGHYDARYPRDNRNRIRAFGRLATTLARQGRYADARELLAEEMTVLQRMPGDDARAGVATLRGRALENEFQFGDMAAAQALLSPEPLALMRVPGLRDADIFITTECRVLLAAGRIDLAAARAQALAAAWPDRDRPTAAWLRILAVRAAVELAQGDAAAARVSASILRELLAKHGGAGGWAHGVATELLALAAARSGDAATAQRELTALESAPRPPAPSAVERAESALRRAQAWQATGAGEQAIAAARAALTDLTGQHEHSPRMPAALHLAAGQP
jgi:serine/threonine-protein kinase